MRLQHHSRILATAAAVAAVAAPAAHASAIGQGGGGESLTAVTAQHASTPRHHSDSTDREMLAIAGTGTVLLFGVGFAGSRRYTRRRASTGPVRAPHVA
jgi:hypothetical protein